MTEKRITVSELNTVSALSRMGGLHKVIDTLERTTAQSRAEAVRTVKDLLRQGYKTNELEKLALGGKTMTKLKIDEQLYSEITSGLAVANGTDLNKLFHITSEISNESLAANQLTIHDIPALVVGNFEVVRKFDIGSYYSLDGVISKITGYDDNRYLIRAEACADGAVVRGDFVTGTQMYCEAKPASEAEILQFDRVYHFHKQGRKLNEFREGDIVFNPARGTYPVFEVIDPYVSPNNIKLVCPVEKRGDR